MEMVKCPSIAISVMITLLAVSMRGATGQLTTACTTSLISSFTPCFNFLTGSTNGGGSPTSSCCTALGALISSSTECACLIVTGNVPLSLPINRTLAISLPRMCKSKSVPLQCQATAMTLPGPGPIAYSPGLPPLPPTGSDTGSGTGSVTTSPSLAPSSTIPASTPAISNTPANQGQRPLLLPSSAVKLSHMYSPPMLVILAVGILFLNKF